MAFHGRQPVNDRRALAHWTGLSPYCSRFAIILEVQFSLETVREVAQILTASGMGEVSLETVGEGPVTRLSLRRPVMVVAAPPGEAPLTEEDDSTSLESQPAVPAVSANITITSTAVGVFRPAKPPLSPGDEVKKKQLVAIVESLKIPFEIHAPSRARVVEVLTADGQGVEWGQPLLVLEPLD